MFVLKRRIVLFLMAICVLVVAWPGGPQPDPQVTSARLLQKMASGEAGDIYKVWVHFAARSLDQRELALALDQAEAELTARAARRRAKVHQPGERLVDMRDLPVSAEALAACEATGARMHQQSRWLNAASFRATAAQVARLTHLSGVQRVDIVAGLHRTDIPTPVENGKTFGIRPDSLDKTTAIDYGSNQAAMVQSNVVVAHDLGLSGAGVLIGMLDTGFRTTHEALVHLPVLATWDFVNNDAIVDNEEGDPAGSRSHGTMTLSTVAGYMPGQLVAPGYGVSVVLAKTEDIAVEVPLEEDNWVAGLEWAEALGADIISSSLGYVDWYVAEDLDGNTAVTTIAADLAAARGVVVVTSAGNDRNTTGHLIAPADADSVITVGAVDSADLTAWFSSPGPTADGRFKPDVAALGVGNTVCDPEDDTNYGGANGTSFSCPLTSGVVALMLHRVPDLTPLQVREALRATASQAGTPDNDQGWGIIDAAAAVTWFGPVIQHTPLVTVEDPAGPYVLDAVIIDRLGLDLGNMRAWYRVDGDLFWQSAPLVSTGVGDNFRAEIPGLASWGVIEYYLRAASINGVATSFPYYGAADPFMFFVTDPSPVDQDRLPALTHLGPNVPNPFNPQTMISFSLARTGPASLRVYDMRGQLVRSLLDSELVEGPHTIRWDGRDRAGRAVSSGTYFYRLVAADQVQQRKMQLVR